MNKRTAGNCMMVAKKILQRGACAALGFILHSAVAAAEVPGGCLQTLLYAETARLSACGTVEGKLVVSRTGTLPGGAHLYFVMEYPGGSGVFSSMVALTEDNGVLVRLFMIAGGDRCYNGIRSAHMRADGGFAVRKNQTPLAMGTGPEDCATCCAGVKEEHYSPTGIRQDDH